MDTSHEYIVMCRQAKELHEGWNPSEGDFVFHKLDGNVVTLPALPELAKVVVVTSCTWLPRLDQLIELFCHTREFKETLRWGDIEIVKHVLGLYGPGHFNRIDLSLERFFLMLLMEGDFGKWKWWNGEEWK